MFKQNNSNNRYQEKNLPPASGHLVHPKYRPDIDGLRAVAVLSVVVYHAFPSLLKGGFIGVDIFFVISGFLISTIIFSSLERDSFSFYDFYSRRIRRIFPALLVVLISCYAFGWFALLADEYKQLGKHIAAGAGFVSNLVLWSESGYFDAAAETKPLLHLWSLGIEEQFYIVWPVLLWAAWKKKFNFFTISLVLFFVSFGLNLSKYRVDGVADFYSPQTRFWELLAGSLLAYVTHHNFLVLGRVKEKLDSWLGKVVYAHPPEVKGQTFRDAQSLFGALLIALGLVLITKEKHFPGTWAILPVLGAVCIISAGSNSWFNRIFLSNRIMVWFGIISFPLYLWHWPLLSFARIIEGELPDRSFRISAVFLSIVLSWLTYKLIEHPLRFGKNNIFKVLVLSLAMTSVSLIGYLTFLKDGLAFGTDNFKIISGMISCQPNKSGVCELGNRKSERKMVIYGDSNMHHLSKQLISKFSSEFSIDIVFAPSCFMGEKLKFDDIGDKEDCNFKIEALKSMSGIAPEVVITGQRWQGYGLVNPEKISIAIKDRINAHGLNPSKLIVLGSAPDIPFDCEKSNMRRISRKKVCQRQDASKKFDLDFVSTTKSLLLPPHVHFVYPSEILCPDGICMIETNGISNFHDGIHISLKGSEPVVNEIEKIVKTKE